MTHHNKISLTASEISGLWTTYINDSMAIPFLKHFQKTVEDKDIEVIINQALSDSQSHLEDIRAIYKQENHAIPIGFGEKDVDLSAPRLFDDTFYCAYIRSMSRIALNSYGLVLSNISRKDIRNFFSNCLNATMKLYDITTDLMLEKGLLRRCPHIEPPKEVTFIDSKKYTSSWLGKQRPLNSQEITEIYFNIQRNGIANTLLQGFSQVAENKKIREYFVKGTKATSEIINTLSITLNDNDLNTSVLWDITATTSQTKTFSDKIMMIHINALSSLGIGYYGIGLGTSGRKDLQTMYTKIIPEVMAYAGDGLDIVIKNNWFERPPQAPDRKKLHRK